MIMKFKTLRKIVDEGSMELTVSNPDLGIIKVSFSINGAWIVAQFDPDNEMVYGYGINGKGLLALLGLDEDGHPEPPEAS
jgi:hypothetical protein